MIAVAFNPNTMAWWTVGLDAAALSGAPWIPRIAESLRSPYDFLQRGDVPEFSSLSLECEGMESQPSVSSAVACLSEARQQG
jgi:hypothetical protein